MKDKKIPAPAAQDLCNLNNCVAILNEYYGTHENLEQYRKKYRDDEIVKKACLVDSHFGEHQIRLLVDEEMECYEV